MAKSEFLSIIGHPKDGLSSRTGDTQIDNGTLRLEGATTYGVASTTITTGGGIVLNDKGTILSQLAGAWNSRIELEMQEKEQ